MAQIQPDRQGYLESRGERVFWELHGQGQRETIVLLNGLAMHTKAWYGVLPRLLDGWDVLLYDYPGQGVSSSEDRPRTLPELASYLSGIADHLRIPRLHVLGISYGGFVALEFARLYRERLLSLTLSGILLSREKLFSLYQDISLRFYAGGPELFGLYTHYMYEKIFGEDFVRRTDPADFEAMRQRFEDRYRDRIHALVRFTKAQDPFFEALEANLPRYQAIDVPTLVLAGAEDRCIPPWVQRKIADVLPRVRFESIPSSGHCGHIEQPEAFFGAFREFLRAPGLAA
jgi:3-oxoadipate enol-lactonase